MKKIITTGLALLLILSSFAGAFAMEVPTDSVIRNLNGTQQYIKIYTVAPDTDPAGLIEQDFTHEGFTYSYAEMTKTSNYYENEKTHSEVMTVETPNKDLSAVLEALDPSIVYDDGVYTGTLYLDHTTIETKAAGFTYRSYTLSDTREFANLDSNDMSFVPQTVTKDGKVLKLVGVDWQVQSTALVDDLLVPNSYKAVAQYSGNAGYNAATGYITTACYSGKVSCKALESITYTVTYVGTPVEIAQTRSYGLFKDQKSLLVGSAGFAVLLAAGIFGTKAAMDAYDRKKASKPAEAEIVDFTEDDLRELMEEEDKKCEEPKYF